MSLIFIYFSISLSKRQAQKPQPRRKATIKIQEIQYWLSLGRMGRLPSSPTVDPLKLLVRSDASGQTPTATETLARQRRARWVPGRPPPTFEGTASLSCPEPESVSFLRLPQARGQVGMSRGPALGPAVPRLRSGRGAGAGPAGEVQEAREPMGTLRGAGLAAAARGRALSGWRASAGHLPSAPLASRPGAPTARARGAAAPSCAAAAPPPCCRSTCWTWTRTRTTWRCSVRWGQWRRVPGKFPINSGSWQRHGLLAQRARPAPAEARSWRWVGSPGCGTRPGPDPQPPFPLHYDLPWGRASCSLQSCDFFPRFRLLFSPLTQTFGDSAQTREAVARKCPSLWQLFFGRSQPQSLGESPKSREMIVDLGLPVGDLRLGDTRGESQVQWGWVRGNPLFGRKGFGWPTGSFSAMELGISQTVSYRHPNHSHRFLPRPASQGNLGPNSPLNL